MISSLSILAQTGVKGTVKDGDTDELLAFVTVVLKGTTKGVTTDFDGNYIMDLSPGKHTIIFSYISYENKEVEVIVPEQGYTTKDVVLGESSFMAQTVTIIGVKTKDDEAAVVEETKKAETAVSATSNKEMAKKAVNNAQDAVKTVTGVSADNSGDVNVRGMNARYISVAINGMVIPGTDPDKNSVQMDLIPTSMLNSIAVSKTFSPDLPGNSTGGAIDMRLKDMPKRKFFQVGASLGANDVTTFNPNFLSYDGGSLDWLGYDDGTRAIPEELKNNTTFESAISDSTRLLSDEGVFFARRDDEIAARVDKAAKSLSNQKVANTITAPFNRKLSLSAGDTLHLGKVNGHTRLLGYLMGLRYSQSFQHRYIENNINWEHHGNDSNNVSYNEGFNLTDISSTSNPNVNAIGSISFEPLDKHKIVLNTMYNHSAVKSGRSLSGEFLSMISDPNSVYYTNTISWQEREMINSQLLGWHTFLKNDSTLIRNVEFNWSYDYFYFTQLEPDLRFFSYDYRTTDSLYFLSKSEYIIPSHFWRALQDVQTAYKADVKVPIFNGDKRKELKNYFKFGMMNSSKSRVFSEATFEIDNDNYSSINEAFTQYNGDIDAFFADSSMGVVDTNGRNTVNNFVREKTDPRNSYTGTSSILAGYGMISFNPLTRWKIITGARVENYKLNVESGDTSQPVQPIDVTDILPAINTVIDLDKKDKHKLRASLTRTVARPTMREAAPFTSFQFIGGPFVLGNPLVERSLINNYDMRYEFYPRRGENITIAAYFKEFENPIARAFKLGTSKPEITWINVENASVYGGEFEFRKNLDSVAVFLKGFDMNTNFSYIISESSIDSLAGDGVRPFPGQSKYLFNFGLGYTNKEAGLNLNLSGNYFSDRLAIIQGVSGEMDVYEKGRFNINFVAKKKMNDKLTLSFTARNILNPAVQLYIKPNGVKEFENGYAYSSYFTGRTYSLSLKYDLFAKGDKN